MPQLYEPDTCWNQLRIKSLQLRLIAKGMNRAQVADALTVSESTVRSHLEHIYSKAGVNSRAAATMFAMEHSLV